MRSLGEPRVVCVEYDTPKGNQLLSELKTELFEEHILYQIRQQQSMTFCVIAKNVC